MPDVDAKNINKNTYTCKKSRTLIIERDSVSASSCFPVAGNPHHYVNDQHRYPCAHLMSGVFHTDTDISFLFAKLAFRGSHFILFSMILNSIAQTLQNPAAFESI